MNIKNLNNNNSTTSTNKTINKKYNDNNKANNTSYKRQLAKIKRQYQTQQNKQTQQTNTTNNDKTATNKNYLQNLLIDYITTNNIDNLQLLANTIVKKTLANYSKYSIDGMYLYNQYQISKKLTQVQQNYNKDNDKDILQALKDIQLKENCDIKDLKQVVLYSLIESTSKIDNATNNIDLIIKLAYKDINKYLYNQRTLNIGNKRPFDYSIEFLSDAGISLVNVNKTIQAYNNYDDDLLDNLYNINNYYNYDDELLTYQRQLIISIFNHLTKQQRQIIKYLSLGNSQRQVANKLNRNLSTIVRHLQAIRQIANNVKNEFDKKYQGV